jgi:hypothetical protein
VTERLLVGNPPLADYSRELTTVSSIRALRYVSKLIMRERNVLADPPLFILHDKIYMALGTFSSNLGAPV